MSAIAQNRHAAWWASIIAMGILLLTGGQNALAVCTFNNQVAEATFVLPAKISVSQRAPHGRRPYRSPRLPVPALGGVCREGHVGHVLAGYLAPMTVSGTPHVYQTNVPGIGVRVTVTEPRAATVAELDVSTWRHRRTDGAGGDLPVADFQFQVELLVTGPVSPGTLSLPSPLAGVYSSDSTTALVNQVLYARLLTRGTTQVITRSCIVDKHDIAIGLPTISPSRLDHVGAVAEAVPFNITLTCDTSLKHFRHRFDGSSPIGMAASTGVLANRADTGDATGVGIQLLMHRSGQDAPTPVTLGRFANFVVDTRADQTVSFPLAARYYKTDSTMTEGAVRAQATFTINYE